jgi:hypothetical protein
MTFTACMERRAIGSADTALSNPKRRSGSVATVFLICFARCFVANRGIHSFLQADWDVRPLRPRTS